MFKSRMLAGGQFMRESILPRTYVKSQYLLRHQSKFNPPAPICLLFGLGIASLPTQSITYCKIGPKCPDVICNFIASFYLESFQSRLGWVCLVLSTLHCVCRGWEEIITFSCGGIPSATQLPLYIPAITILVWLKLCTILLYPQSSMCTM